SASGEAPTSPIPDRRVVRRVIHADIGAVGGDALVVEEQLGPVAPVGCHLLVVDVRRRVLRVLPPSGVVQGKEPVVAVTGALLNVGGPVLVVGHVALVVDRFDVTHGR